MNYRRNHTLTEMDTHTSVSCHSSCGLPSMPRQEGHAVPTEIFSSSYVRDGGHQFDFFENTAREAKVMSLSELSALVIRRPMSTQSCSTRARWWISSALSRKAASAHLDRGLAHLIPCGGHLFVCSIQHPQKGNWWQNGNIGKGMQDEQVLIPADDGIGPSRHGHLQKLVVLVGQG